MDIMTLGHLVRRVRKQAGLRQDELAGAAGVGIRFIVDLESGKTRESTHQPSYELPMHLAVYRARLEVNAIVHTHSPFVTTLSTLHRPLPPIIDEMVMYFGGTVEVTDYAFTGTEGVGTNVLRIGRDLRQALHVAITMESCARVYLQAMQSGEPVLLPDDAIAAGRRLFEEKYRV